MRHRAALFCLQLGDGLRVSFRSRIDPGKADVIRVTTEYLLCLIVLAGSVVGIPYLTW